MPRKAKRVCEDNLLEKGLHVLDLRNLAIECIKAFLAQKQSYEGRPLSSEELITDDNIKTVLRTQFDDETFLFIHNKCLSRIPQPDWYKESTVPWNVHYLLGLLQELKYLKLPKDFQPGLLLLYFKYCKGFDIPPPPLL
jgi:hypothetical protein